MALLWSCCRSLRFSFGQVQSYWHTLYHIYSNDMPKSKTQVSSTNQLNTLYLLKVICFPSSCKERCQSRTNCKLHNGKSSIFQGMIIVVEKHSRCNICRSSTVELCTYIVTIIELILSILFGLIQSIYIIQISILSFEYFCFFDISFQGYIDVGDGC